MTTKKRKYGHVSVTGKLFSLLTGTAFMMFVNTKLEERAIMVGIKDLIGYDLQEEGKTRTFILKVRDSSGIKLNLTGVSDDDIAYVIEDIEEALEK